MTEQEFKTTFVATFLASWCSSNYADYCANGWQDRLRHPPVEDAVDLAEAAWLEYLNQ